MAEPRKSGRRRLAWLVVAAVFGAGAVWALVPKARHEEKSDDDDDSDRAAADQDQTARIRQALEQLRQGQGDPASLQARKDALTILLSDGQMVPAKLTAVLDAVEADPSQPEKDPLWADLVQGLAALWHGENVDWGLNAMATETRPRAQRALVSSFAAMTMSERATQMTGAQSQTLTNYFIDHFGQMPSGQQPEVTGALRRLAGNDVADVLLGKGLNSDNGLEIHRERQLALEAGRAIVQAHAQSEAQAQARAQAEAQAQAQAEAQLQAQLQAQPQHPAPAAGEPAAPSDNPTPAPSVQ